MAFFSLKVHFLRENILEFLCREPQLERALDSHADAAGLFGHYDGYGVGVLRDAERGAVAQSELLRYVVVVRHGQDAAGRARKRLPTIIMAPSCSGEFLKKMSSMSRWLMRASITSPVSTMSSRRMPRSMTMSAPTLPRERSMHAMTMGMMVSLSTIFSLLAPTNRLAKARKRWWAPSRVEEAAYLFLEEHDDADDAHRHELVEDGSEQAHLEHLTHEEPHEHEHDDADEDVERTALLHQTIDVVEHQGDKKYVDDVFYSEVEHILSVEC